MRDLWVVAGSEENTVAPLEEVDQRTPRIVLVSPDGPQALPLPHPEAESPVPVLLDGDRWGLVWATVDPPPAYADGWLEGLYTDLWWAEWTSTGWSEALHLVRADLGLEWDDTRVLRSAPDGSVFLMVTGRSEDLRRRVFFGEIRTAVRPLSIEAESPLFGSFLFETKEKARVFVAVRNERARAVDIVEAQVEVPGGAVGGARTIARVPTGQVGGTLQALQHGAGQVHLLWSNQDLTGIHGVSQTEGGEWKRDDPGEPDELLFQWVAGVAAVCGRAAIYAMVLDRDGSFRLRVSRWEDSWGEFVDQYPSQISIYPLQGTSADGGWLLGWGGEGGADTAPEYGFWALKP